MINKRQKKKPMKNFLKLHNEQLPELFSTVNSKYFQSMGFDQLQFRTAKKFI